MVLHNPGDWHYVSKDVTAPTNQLFEDKFKDLAAEEGDVTAKVSKVHPLGGSVDVSQKRGKVSALLMMTLDVNFTGSAPDAEEVTGTISLDEIDSTMEPDEYQYTVKLDEDKAEHKPVKDLVQRKILPEIKKTFDGLIPYLIKEYGGDIQHKKGEDPSSGFAKAAVHPEKKASPAPVATTAQQNKTGVVTNTTSLTDNVEFRTSAEDLFQVFTDPQRITAFTRSPPKVFEGAQPGGKFELFDGNVSGEFKEVDKPNRIVQSWRLASWPKDHYSTLKMDFKQDNEQGVTKLDVHWDGVPVGEEDVTKMNWQHYYVTSIMMTFGYGSRLV